MPNRWNETCAPASVQPRPPSVANLSVIGTPQLQLYLVRTTYCGVWSCYRCGAVRCRSVGVYLSRNINSKIGTWQFCTTQYETSWIESKRHYCQVLHATTPDPESGHDLVLVLSRTPTMCSPADCLGIHERKPLGGEFWCFFMRPACTTLLIHV